MAGRELGGRQFMAPDVYPVAPREAQHVSTWQALLFMAAFIAPIVLCMAAA